jgi:hypothetical protein
MGNQDDVNFPTVTIDRLMTALTNAIQDAPIDGETQILWTDVHKAGDQYDEYDIPEGTMLIGLRTWRDGEERCGTRTIQPEKLSKYLN